MENIGQRGNARLVGAESSARAEASTRRRWLRRLGGAAGLSVVLTASAASVTQPDQSGPGPGERTHTVSVETAQGSENTGVIDRMPRRQPAHRIQPTVQVQSEVMTTATTVRPVSREGQLPPAKEVQAREADSPARPLPDQPVVTTTTFIEVTTTSTSVPPETVLAPMASDSTVMAEISPATTEYVPEETTTTIQEQAMPEIPRQPAFEAAKAEASDYFAAKGIPIPFREPVPGLTCYGDTAYGCTTKNEIQLDQRLVDEQIEYPSFVRYVVLLEAANYVALNAALPDRDLTGTPGSILFGGGTTVEYAEVPQVCLATSLTGLEPADVMPVSVSAASTVYSCSESQAAASAEFWAQPTLADMSAFVVAKAALLPDQSGG